MYVLCHSLVLQILLPNRLYSAKLVINYLIFIAFSTHVFGVYFHLVLGCFLIRGVSLKGRQKTMNIHLLSVLS